MDNEWIAVEDELPARGDTIYDVKIRVGSMSPSTITGTSLFGFGTSYLPRWSATGDWRYVTHWKKNK